MKHPLLLGVTGLSLACWYGVKHIKDHNHDIRIEIELLKERHTNDKDIDMFIHKMNTLMYHDIVNKKYVDFMTCLKLAIKSLNPSASLTLNLKRLFSNISATDDLIGTFEKNLKLMSELFYDSTFVSYMHQLKDIASGSVPDNKALHNDQVKYDAHYQKYLNELRSKKDQIINLAWDKRKFNLIKNYIQHKYHNYIKKHQN